MKNEIAQLTVQESRERLTKDSVILIPMGSLEDQGVHAPMGDYLAAKLIADRIAQSATKAGVPTYCAPVIPFGAEDFFGLSHGGIALRPTTLAALLDDLIASLERHGLRRLVFINGHGGNVPVIANVSVHWRRNKNLFLTSLYLWQMAYGILKEILPEDEAKSSSGHGADPLTSVGLYLYPELLRMDLAKPPPASAKVKGVEVGGFGYLSYAGVPVQAPIEAAEAAPDGIWGGSPLRSSAERGQILVDRLVSIATGYIRDHVATDFGAK